MLHGNCGNLGWTNKLERMNWSLLSSFTLNITGLVFSRLIFWIKWKFWHFGWTKEFQQVNEQTANFILYYKLCLYDVTTVSIKYAIQVSWSNAFRYNNKHLSSDFSNLLNSIITTWGLLEFKFHSCIGYMCNPVPRPPILLNRIFYPGTKSILNVLIKPFLVYFSRKF